MIVVVWFVFALLFAFLTAGMAKRRGRDGAVWGILGFLFGIFAMLILLVLGKTQSPAGGAVQYAAVAIPAPSRLEEIEKLKNLLDSDAITQEEFNTMKKKLLS